MPLERPPIPGNTGFAILRGAQKGPFWADVAIVLGFHEHDIAQLVVSKLLTPLGKPVHNSPKHFAAVDVIEAAQEREWLSTATRQISRYWKSRNEKKRVPPVLENEDGSNANAGS